MSVVCSPPLVVTCYSSPRTFSRQVNQLVVQRSCFKRLPGRCSPWASVVGALSKPFTQSSKQAQRCWATCPGHTARKRALGSNPCLSDPGRCTQPVLSLGPIRTQGWVTWVPSAPPYIQGVPPGAFTGLCPSPASPRDLVGEGALSSLCANKATAPGAK